MGSPLVSYKQSISFAGELSRAKLAKRLVLQIKDLNTATLSSGKVDCSSACDSAVSALNSLISTIED